MVPLEWQLSRTHQPTSSISRDGDSSPVAHVPPSSSVVTYGGYTSAALGWEEKVPCVAVVLDHKHQPACAALTTDVRKFIAALAPADDFIKHGGILQLE